MPDRRKKICVVVASRANLARITTVLEAVRDHPALQLQVIAAASALLERFGNAADILEAAGFTPDAKIPFIIEGQTPATMARSTGLGLLELPTAFERLEPDVVLTVGRPFRDDRDGHRRRLHEHPRRPHPGRRCLRSIDESVRHAITKLSHIQFPATELSARRIIAMGEDPRYVFCAGCPSIDLAARAPVGTRHDALINHCGAGSPIDPDQPFLLVMQHGVTTEYGHGLEQMTATLRAVSSIGMQALVFWPNVDTGSADVAAGIRQVRAHRLAQRCEFFSNLHPEDFVQLMIHCACMIGNSSAALREGAYLGTPAVNVGTRQQHRECGANVVFTSHDPAEIAEAIRAQLAHGRYPRDDLFGTGTAGRDIADVLATVNPPVQSGSIYDPATLLAGYHSAPCVP